MESDADRLAEIQALGGQRVFIRGAEFWALFDRQYQSVALGQLEIESRSPALTCRTSDVERLALVKDDPIDGLPEPFRVKAHEPDGTGMSVVVLKR